jgi:hypothetical protein
MTRLIVLALVALGLCGCRMASSDRPVFSSADTADAPALKAGLWALIEPGCRFNTRTAPEKWPDCATALALRDGAAIDAGKGQTGKRSVLIVGGDPAIIQTEAEEDGRRAFVYLGLRPLAADSDGTITRARVWPAACPPAAPTPRGRRGPPRSDPCQMRGQGPVRAAVAASEGVAFAGEAGDTGRIAYWLRDKDR